MINIFIPAIFVAVFLISSHAFGQVPNSYPTKKIAGIGIANVQKSSPAYAEVLLRRTEIESQLESLLLDYTEEYSKVAELQYSLKTLKEEGDRILAVKPAESSKLTLALGKLIVRKVELETDLWGLLKHYKEEHPDVKRAKRKVEIYEAAIKEILG